MDAVIDVLGVPLAELVAVVMLEAVDDGVGAELLDAVIEVLGVLLGEVVGSAVVEWVDDGDEVGLAVGEGVKEGNTSCTLPAVDGSSLSPISPV